MRISADTTFRELHEAGLISTRTCNVLCCTDAKTLGEFVNYYKLEEVLKFRNFGKNSYQEIKAVYERYKQQLEAAAHAAKLARLDRLSPVEQGVITRAYELLAGQDGLLRQMYSTAVCLHATVCKGADKVSAFHQGLSVDENLRLRAHCLSFIDEVGKDLDSETALGALYQTRGEELRKLGNALPCSQIYNEYLDGLPLETFISFWKDQICSLFGYKVNPSLISLLGNFDNVVELFDVPSSEYTSHFSSLKELSPKQVVRLEQIVTAIKERLDRILRQDDRQVQIEGVLDKYRYLTEEDGRFLRDFVDKQGHLPMFYLLYQQMRKSYKVDTQCYALRYGLRDGQCYSAVQIGKRVSLSDTRVGQFLKQKDKIMTPISEEKDWSHYQALLHSPLLSEEDPAVQQLIQQEQLPTDWDAMVRLLALPGPHEVLSLNEKTVLYKTSPDYELNTYICCMTFEELAFHRRTANEVMDLDRIAKRIFFERWNFDDVPGECPAEFKELIQAIGERCYGLRLNEQGQFILPANYTNVKQAVIDILERRGEPMSLEELLSVYNAENPHYKMDTVERFAERLPDSSVMKTVGITGRYALTKWDHVFFGTIRELVADTLAKAGKPVSPEALLSEVQKYYPNTSLDSLRANIRTDASKRFRVLPSGRYALAKEKEPAPKRPRLKR